MPLYEYACPTCQHTFEELVFGNGPVECPRCQSTAVERLLSVPARPQADAAATSLPMQCDGGPGPSCGAPWCRRTGG